MSKMRLTPDPVLDGPDPDEGGPWGVWETRCITCGKKIVLVATVHSVDYGYSETMPQDAQCTECLGRKGKS